MRLSLIDGVPLYLVLIGFLRYFILVACVLISVAFLTLFERRGLGYIQIRKGPNKVGPLGIFQPFADAIKLFRKEGMFPVVSNYLPYYFCPVFALFLSMLIWQVCPLLRGYDFPLGALFIFSLVAIRVYRIIGSG